jgi:hypothetical protein
MNDQITDNVSEVTEADNKKLRNSKADAENSASTKSMSKVINIIADAVGDLVRANDRKEAVSKTQDILSTLMQINSLGEYELGLRVGGELYRFSEYQVPTKLAALVVAAKVVVSDVNTAVDFLDRKKYAVDGVILNPSQFYASCKKLCVLLRVNPEFQALSRPSVELLSEATKYAVNGGKVCDLKQNRIYFLKQRFDSEQVVKIDEWAVMRAMELF